MDVFNMYIKSNNEIHYGESYTKKRKPCISNSEQCSSVSICDFIFWYGGTFSFVFHLHGILHYHPIILYTGANRKRGREWNNSDAPIPRLHKSDGKILLKKRQPLPSNCDRSPTAMQQSPLSPPRRSPGELVMFHVSPYIDFCLWTLTRVSSSLTVFLVWIECITTEGWSKWEGLPHRRPLHGLETWCGLVEVPAWGGVQRLHGAGILLRLGAAAARERSGVGEDALDYADTWRRQPAPYNWFVTIGVEASTRYGEVDR